MLSAHSNKTGNTSMFNFQGKTFVNDNLNGTFSYVGSVPAVLMSWHKATIIDIRAGRAVETPAGNLIAGKSFIADTEQEAIDYAADLGIEISV
jgi:hypothetical protein